MAVDPYQIGRAPFSGYESATRLGLMRDQVKAQIANQQKSQQLLDQVLELLSAEAGKETIAEEMAAEEAAKQVQQRREAELANILAFQAATARNPELAEMFSPGALTGRGRPGARAASQARLDDAAASPFAFNALNDPGRSFRLPPMGGPIGLIDRGVMGTVDALRSFGGFIQEQSLANEEARLAALNEAFMSRLDAPPGMARGQVAVGAQNTPVPAFADLMSADTVVGPLDPDVMAALQGLQIGSQRAQRMFGPRNDALDEQLDSVSTMLDALRRRRGR